MIHQQGEAVTLFNGLRGTALCMPTVVASDTPSVVFANIASASTLADNIADLKEAMTRNGAPSGSLLLPPHYTQEILLIISDSLPELQQGGTQITLNRKPLASQGISVRASRHPDRLNDLVLQTRAIIAHHQF